jgi:pterin-4a-carbinolamine dehydratase
MRLLTYSARVNAKHLQTSTHHCIRSSAADLYNARVPFHGTGTTAITGGKPASWTIAHRYASTDTKSTLESVGQIPNIPRARQIKLAGMKTTIVSKSNIEQLTRELEPLVKRPSKPASNLHVTFGEQCWRVNCDGDAIYRALAFPSRSIAKEAIAEIQKTGDTLNHHASFANMTPDIDSPSHNLVICSTHSPRGLTIRDIRLAKEVDEVLSKYNIYTSPLTLFNNSGGSGDQYENFGEASGDTVQAEDSARDMIANAKQRVQSAIRRIVDRDTAQSFKKNAI